MPARVPLQQPIEPRAYPLAKLTSVGVACAGDVDDLGFETLPGKVAGRGLGMLPAWATSTSEEHAAHSTGLQVSRDAEVPLVMLTVAAFPEQGTGEATRMARQGEGTHARTLRIAGVDGGIEIDPLGPARSECLQRHRHFIRQPRVAVVVEPRRVDPLLGVGRKAAGAEHEASALGQHPAPMGAVEGRLAARPVGGDPNRLASLGPYRRGHHGREETIERELFEGGRLEFASRRDPGLGKVRHHRCWSRDLRWRRRVGHGALGSRSRRHTGAAAERPRDGQKTAHEKHAHQGW